MRSPAAAFVIPCLTLGLASASACDRESELKHEAVSAPPQSPAKAETRSNFRLPGAGRVVAIGDVHGDLNALRGALRLAGAIDTDDRWIGKNLSVVQTGDQLDRGDQDREVLDVLEKLEVEAKPAGSALVVLNGNHELMNVAFDFRYVTPKSFASFNEFAREAGSVAQRVPEGERGRAAAFSPGAPYALKLSKRLTVAVVGDSLFAHGGVLPAHLDYGLDRLNDEASAFLAGKLRELPQALSAQDAPVWTRLYGGPQVQDEVCQGLGRVLQQVGAKRLVVGHTVQKEGINSACREQLFRIDVGLSAYYGDNPPQVLEITAQGTRILKGGAAGSPRVPKRDSKRGKLSESALHSAP